MPKLNLIKTLDGHEVALWSVSLDTSTTNTNTGTDILMIHGAFSDKRIFIGLANFLAKQGYNVWIVEWRSHGSSDKAITHFTFETIAYQEIKASFDYLLNDCQINNLQCITHSGGGICLTMFLIKNMQFTARINCIVMLSCQSHGACGTRKAYFKVLLAKVLSKSIGFIPGKLLKIGHHNESYHTMRPWFNWNLRHQFLGDDGFDFLPAMKKINIPILFLSSENDTFIAPKKGCKMFYEAFENPNNRWLHCSKSGGYLEDYGHSRILLSRNAATEIWPIIRSWLKA